MSLVKQEPNMCKTTRSNPGYFLSLQSSLCVLAKLSPCRLAKGLRLPSSIVALSFKPPWASNICSLSSTLKFDKTKSANFYKVSMLSTQTNIPEVNDTSAIFSQPTVSNLNLTLDPSSDCSRRPAPSCLLDHMATLLPAAVHHPCYCPAGC